MEEHSKITFTEVLNKTYPLSERGILYLESRGLSKDSFLKEAFTFFDSESREFLCFPLYNWLWDDGVISFVLRSLKEKFYYTIVGENQPSYYYGLTKENLKSCLESGYIIIVEGVIDYLSLKPMNNVIVQLTNTPSRLLIRDLILFNLSICWIYDTDKAGLKEGRKIVKHYVKKYNLKGREELIPYKDVNEFLRRDPIIFNVWKKGLMKGLIRA